MGAERALYIPFLSQGTMYVSWERYPCQILKKPTPELLLRIQAALQLIPSTLSTLTESCFLSQTLLILDIFSASHIQISAARKQSSGKFFDTFSGLVRGIGWLGTRTSFCRTSKHRDEVATGWCVKTKARPGSERINIRMATFISG